MFILDEVFTLYKNIVYWIRVWFILALWGVTIIVLINLFRNDVTLNIPFGNVEVSNYDDFDTITTSNKPTGMSNYSDLPIKISIYDPEIGGINCAYPCDTMASGEKVVDWWGRGAACAAEFPFGTRLWIDGVGEVVCQDRGTAIVNNGEFIWIDLLLHKSDFGTVPPFGTLVYDWGIINE